MVGQHLEAVQPQTVDGVVELANRPVGVGRDLPLRNVGQCLNAVGVRPHRVRDEVVPDAQVRRPVQERPVDLGVVHLGDQIVGRELHVHHRRRHILLEVVLAVHSPFEAPELRRPKVCLLQRVEPSRHRLVD